VSLRNTSRNVVPGGTPVGSGCWLFSSLLMSAEARPDSLETTASGFWSSPPRAARTPLAASSTSDAASTNHRLR
jgi:hypothetical protein